MSIRADIRILAYRRAKAPFIYLPIRSGIRDRFDVSVSKRYNDSNIHIPTTPHDERRPSP